MATNEPLNNAADEVAAAEAELKAAQERLEAAKAKLSSQAEDTVEVAEDTSESVDKLVGDASEQVEEVLTEAVIVEDADGVVEAVVVEEVGSAEDAAPESASASEPAAEAAPDAQAAPTWVPYSTNQNVPPQYGASDQPSYGTVPPVHAAGYQAPGYQAPGYQVPGSAANAQAQHAGPGAVPPQQPYYGYQQPPYYQQPYGQPVVATKDHVAAGLLAIFLGWLGIHKFYLGYNTAGFIMLAVTILGSLFTFGLAGGVIWVISIIEGILYLTKSQAEFEQMYVINKREWF